MYDKEYKTTCIAQQIITTILLVAVILTVSSARALKMSLNALSTEVGELILRTALPLPAQILILLSTVRTVLVSGLDECSAGTHSGVALPGTVV